MTVDGSRTGGGRGVFSRELLLLASLLVSHIALGFVAPLVATRSTSARFTLVSPLRAASDDDVGRRVAVVTGASRGIGRGIAVELGAAGFVVYAVGRSSRTNDRPPPLDDDDDDLTVEATAEAVDARGGVGRPVVRDLSEDGAIERVLENVARETNGRLDVLVCSAYQVPPAGTLRGDFWEQGMDMWDAVNGLGLRQVYAACRAATPRMIETAKLTVARAPLVVLVSSFGGKSYTFNVAYGVGKAAIDRLAVDAAYQLRKHDVATVALYPGLVRTENNLAMEREGTWDEASGGLDLTFGETPAFSGKAVAALAALPREKLLERSGQVEVVAELADEFGFDDGDNDRPRSIRSLKYLLPNFVFPKIEKENGGKEIPKWIKDNVPDILLPWSVFAGPPPEMDD